MRYWAIRWRSFSPLGSRDYYVGDYKAVGRAGPILFRTRRLARAWRDERYGYIRNRPDLKAEPHCWTLPRVERVEVIIKPVGDPHGTEESE